MKKNQNKKGFTLVELLVVIAILAILATVSIVGYTSFTKKAKISNDISLTTQMNTILQAEEVDGETFDTPHDAITALKEGGLDVTKLTPTTDGHSYVYDVNGTNGQKMILVDENKDVIAPEGASINTSSKERYFFFASTYKEVEDYTNDGYSVYLKYGFTTTAALKVKAGLDVGSNENIGVELTSSEAKTYLLRTNGETLTVNAENATVHHYGAANYANIKAIKGESYHENGSLAYVRIEKGHFVAEKEAKVIELNVAASDVIISEESGSTVASYSKGSSDVTVKVNGATKDVSDVKTEKQVEDAAKSIEIVESGVAEIGGIQFKTLQSAFDMAHNNDVIVLNEDVNIEEELVFNKNVECVLNMNNKTIKNVATIWVDYITSSVLNIKAGKITITGNGTISAMEGDCYGINVGTESNEAICVIENGTIIGDCSAVQVTKGTLTIKGGYIKAYGNFALTYTINCIDKYYKNNTAIVKIEGGTFDNFNPSSNGAEGNNTNFLSEGYKVNLETKEIGGVNHNLYTVVKE